MCMDVVIEITAIIGEFSNGRGSLNSLVHNVPIAIPISTTHVWLFC